MRMMASHIRARVVREYIFLTTFLAASRLLAGVIPHAACLVLIYSVHSVHAE